MEICLLLQHLIKNKNCCIFEITINNKECNEIDHTFMLIIILIRYRASYERCILQNVFPIKVIRSHFVRNIIPYIKLIYIKTYKQFIHIYCMGIIILLYLAATYM